MILDYSHFGKVSLRHSCTLGVGRTMAARRDVALLATLRKNSVFSPSSIAQQPELQNINNLTCLFFIIAPYQESADESKRAGDCMLRLGGSLAGALWGFTVEGKTKFSLIILSASPKGSSSSFEKAQVGLSTTLHHPYASTSPNFPL